jgi:hypothetical protein
MTPNKEQIRDLLGTGLSPSIVATAVGCSPSYISQLMAEENFAQEVAKLRMAALSANGRRDRNIDRLEDKILGKLEDAIDAGMVYKHRDLLSAFNVLNKAQRRGAPPQQATVINNQVVNLNLPPRVVNKYVTNVQGEVIQIGENKTLVTMPAGNLLQKLAESGRNPERYKDVQRYLPGSTIRNLASASEEK